MRFEKGHVSWLKGTKGLITSWNKGIKIDREKFPNVGHFKKHSEEAKKKMSDSLKGKSSCFKGKHTGGTSWNKGKKGYINSGSFKNGHLGLIGEKNPLWKGGISKDKEYGKLAHRQRYARYKNAGKLSIKVIQLVYEDNIKQFGTLTCYLCIKPISFGKDHLEHKTPLSRGGNNEYANLGIACQGCNCKKHNKTVEEFKKEVFKK